VGIQSLRTSGINNFVRSRSMLVGNEAFEPGSFDLISTTILGSSEPSIVFNNLNDYSSTYKHLQIRASARTSSASNGATGSLRLNADTGSNYAWRYIQATGSAVQSEGVASDTEMENFYAINAANDVASGFTSIVIDILEPYSTTKNKTVRAFSGVVGNENRIRIGSGLWMNTQALTSATMFSTSGESFVAGSRFSIYGIKG
jgi:hypothetical protein